MATGKQRVRMANYTLEEKLRLMNIIAKYKNIVECKKTDVSTCFEKNSAWDKITVEFNAESARKIRRDKDSLKKFFKNKKSEMRKIAACSKLEVRRTGGGKFIPKEDPCLGVVMEIISNKNIGGLPDGLGGDAAELQQPADPEIKKEIDENILLEEDAQNYILDDPSTSYEKSSTTIEKGNSNSHKSLDSNEKSNEKLGVDTQRRRPKAIQPVHTNFLSEQYSELANWKETYLHRELEIIEARELRDQEAFLLKKRSLELDIEIKELQLKKLKCGFV